MDWGDDVGGTAHSTVRGWECVGETGMYMIFHWLKSPTLGGVKTVLEVIVDDFGDEKRRPHSDNAIVECLQSLGVETWNWQRMDISSDVIARAAGETVKTR